MVGGRCSLPSEICAQNNPLLQKTPTSADLLIAYQLYEMAKKFNYDEWKGDQRAIDAVHMLLLSLPKGGSKSNFCFLNKVCYKVFCVKASSGKVVV